MSLPAPASSSYSSASASMPGLASYGAAGSLIGTATPRALACVQGTLREAARRGQCAPAVPSSRRNVCSTCCMPRGIESGDCDAQLLHRTKARAQVQRKWWLLRPCQLRVLAFRMAKAFARERTSRHTTIPDLTSSLCKTHRSTVERPSTGTAYAQPIMSDEELETKPFKFVTGKYFSVSAHVRIIANGTQPVRFFPRRTLRNAVRSSQH